MNLEEFKGQFDIEQTGMDQAVRKFPWQNVEAYIGWLVNSYEYADNSTRILAMAGGVMPGHLTKLSNRFVAHAAEERGHERLLENDAKALGVDIKTAEPTVEMKMFHRSLYYWLSQHGSPVGLMGWVFALEGLAVRQGPWIYDVCKEAHGPKATGFLKVHSNEDPDHLEKAFGALSFLSAGELDLVAASLHDYIHQYVAVLQAVPRVVAQVAA